MYTVRIAENVVWKRHHNHIIPMPDEDSSLPDIPLPQIIDNEIFRLVHGNGIPMKWNGIGWDSTHCISHGTNGIEIDEQEIKNMLNKYSDSKFEYQNDNEFEFF